MKGLSEILLPLQLGNGLTELAGQGSQRGEGRFLRLTPEAVQYASEDSLLSSSMNVRVVTTEVAQAGLQPIGSFFLLAEAFLAPDAFAPAADSGLR